VTGARGRGALVLVSTPIGNLGDLSPRAADELRGADVIAAEDTRQTRKLLSLVEIPAGNRLRSVHAHNEQREAASIVELIRSGSRVVLVTDAGTPAVSDPGVRRRGAHGRGRARPERGARGTRRLGPADDAVRVRRLPRAQGRRAHRAD
jgi:hypothetical protein